MIKKVLLSLLAALLITFLAVWLWTGGPRKAWNEAQKIGSIGSFFFGASSTGATFRLPWQPKIIGVDPSLYDFSELQDGGGSSYAQDEQPDAAARERAYDEANKQYAEARNFGTPSPYRGQVRIESSMGARESDAQSEYVELAASSYNTAPVSLTGWSLQSALAGARIAIQRGADPFYMGVVNVQNLIRLEPGMRAVIATGVSPVGTSFRENMCSGYLGQLQRFSPSISSNCPSPSSMLPITDENLRLYGESCFDYLQSAPQCSAPLSDMPTHVSANCRVFLQNNLSYNGCVNANRWRTSFNEDTWRIYLGARSELWGNSHDVVRLLDAEGRTVDVVTY